MDYWYHRIKHCSEVSYPLFEMGYLTAGLSEIALQYPKIVTGAFDKNDIKKMFEYTYKDRHNKKLFEKVKGVFKERAVPASWSFFSFICEFKAGDKVIVPDYPVKSHFVICEVLEKADLIGNLPIKHLVDTKGNDITFEDGLLRRNYIEFIDLGFFIKVKILTKPIDGTLKGVLAVSGSLNKISEQIEEFIQKNRDKEQGTSD